MARGQTLARLRLTRASQVLVQPELAYIADSSETLFQNWKIGWEVLAADPLYGIPASCSNLASFVPLYSEGNEDSERDVSEI